MHIIVFLKMVPDVIEELKVADDHKALDQDWLRMKLNECDEHALEEAIILKEKYGGDVIAIAPDAPELDDTLFAALAKGADKVYRISGDWQNMRSPAMAEVFHRFIKENNIQLDEQTLILTGSQAIDDLEGEVIYYLSELLDIPVFGVITKVAYSQESHNIRFIKEFSGGIRGEFEAALPAILGIQAAENPLRYIPVSKIRAVMKTASIEDMDISTADLPEPLDITELYEHVTTGKAAMIEGSPDIISGKIADILTEKGII